MPLDIHILSRAANPLEYMHGRRLSPVPAGGGPGGGCARTPVGTHPHLLVVGADNPIALPSLARLGDRHGEIRRLR
jgi:hypothetical protein